MTIRLNKEMCRRDRISTFQLLVAGDTIVNFEDINIQAFERVGGKQKKLCARIADNGQGSFCLLYTSQGKQTRTFSFAFI